MGRKLHYFNGYKLWAGGQPDFLYPASGDSSDYMYGVLGVASYGLELGQEQYEDCVLFEGTVVPRNLPALLYAAKTATKPFSLPKGPDILNLTVSSSENGWRVTVEASDSLYANSLEHVPDFPTADQRVEEVRLYLDVHPDDFAKGDAAWKMQAVPANGRF